MYIYDISRNIFDTPPYEGDPETYTEYVKSIEKGDEYNLSLFSMSSHTGTHIDAPYHFWPDGKRINEIRTAVFYGKCSVITTDRILTGQDMEHILPKCRKRLLIRTKGDGGIESSAANVIADSDLVLIGIDRQSIGAEFDNFRTHLALARGDVTILENLDLSGIEDGNDYTLSAFPIRLDGLEAAPCRAILFEQEKGF